MAGAGLQERLFEGDLARPEGAKRQRRVRAGRPRDGDESPTRTVEVEFNLRERRFLEREARRLGVSRNEVIQRAVRAQMLYAETSVSRALDARADHDAEA